MAKTKVTAATILGRITYTSIYVFLCFILAILLLIVPADIVRQVLNHTFQRANVLVLAIVYVLTLIVVVFVYALRLYTTRTVLASIPKLCVPVEKGDVNKEVRAMIVASLGRSAAIAWEARPKVLPSPQVNERLEVILEGATESAVEITRTNDEQEKHQKRRLSKFWGRLGRAPTQKLKHKQKPRTTVADQMGIALPPVLPVWGHVEHDGWESPGSPDLPNLQYATVLAELPNLIEAKAVSLAPPDLHPAAADMPPVLDPEAVTLLQRAASMSMRDYVGHLVNLRMLMSATESSPEEQDGGQQSHIVPEFLDAYERARFSTRPMSKALFRNLMHLFAELLRAMRSPDPSVLFGEDEGSDGFEDGYSMKLYDGGGDGVSVSESDGHIDDDAPRDGSPTTPTRSIDRNLSGSQRNRRVIHSGSYESSVRSNVSSSYSQRRRRRPLQPSAMFDAQQQQQQQHQQQHQQHQQHQQQHYQHQHQHQHQRQQQSRRPQQQYIGDRDRTSSSANTWRQQRYRTAPTTPMGRRFGGGLNNDVVSRSPSHRSESSESIDTFARTRRPYTLSSSSSSSQRQPSSHATPSLRSFSSGQSRATGFSGGSGSQGSVIIRLAQPEDGDDARGLPYVLRMG